MGFLNKIIEWISPKSEMVVSDRPGRNEQCWCGSGAKYKRCHLDADAEKISKARAVNCKTT